jgi:hypothetical protein
MMGVLDRLLKRYLRFDYLAARGSVLRDGYWEEPRCLEMIDRLEDEKEP